MTALYSLLIKQRSDLRAQVKRNIHEYTAKLPAVQPEEGSSEEESDSDEEDEDLTGRPCPSTTSAKTTCTYTEVLNRLRAQEGEFDAEIAKLEEEIQAMKGDLTT